MQRGRQYQHLAWLQATLCLLLFACASPARAQIPTYTTPQIVQKALATNAACSGIAQTFPVPNLGQNQHSATLSVSNTTSAAVFIQGEDSAGNVFPISDTVFAVHTFASSPAVTASGYFPIVNVVVTCSSGGTFTLNYAGTSSQANVLSGAYLNGAIDKAIFQLAPQNASAIAQQFVPPFGSSYGLLVFEYQNSAVSGSSLAVNCEANGTAAGVASYSFNLAAVTTVQLFPVPNGLCPLLTVSYTSGGASIQTFSLDYLLWPNGSPANTTLGSYNHITGTTATAVKATPGTLVSLNVNTPASGTVSIFDLATASCTGTPATNTVAVITASATAPLGTFFYNLQFLNGICVKASAAMDLTVSYQ